MVNYQKTSENPLPHANGLAALTAGQVAGQNIVEVVGSAGTIMTSTAANSWALQNSGTSSSLNGATFGAGLLVAVGDPPQSRINALQRSRWFR